MAGETNSTHLPLCWPAASVLATTSLLSSPLIFVFGLLGRGPGSQLDPPPPPFLLVIAPLEDLCFLLSAVFLNFYMCVWSDGDKLGDLLKGSELSHCARVGGEAFKKGKKEKKRKKVLDYEINLSWNQE